MSENFEQDLTKATELEVDANVVDEVPAAEVTEPAVEEKVEVKEAVEEPTKEETAKVEEVPVEDPEENKEGEEVTEEHPEGCECEKCKAAKEASDKEQEQKPEEKAKAKEEKETVDKQAEEEVEEEDKQKEIEELNAKLAEMEFDKKEVENIRQYQIDRANIEEQVKQQTDLLSAKLNEAFAHFGIDPSKTLDELKAEDVTKAAIAQGLIDSAIQKRNEAINKARQEITRMEDELIFNRVEKEVEKYHLTPEQMKATAETFIAIMNETGIADLAEDLRAKVKLAVAQAVMDNPRVEKKEEEITEKEDEKELETIEEVPAVKEEKEEEQPKVEKVVEEEAPTKPDLSEFKEGVDGGTTPTAAVTEDNIIETIAALPYRERTKFITENYDVYMTAMRKARAKGE